MYATPAGTSRFALGFPQHRLFYRRAQGLTVSSLGIGTYLGEADAATDAAYTEAVREALAGGINFIDTAINYRHQRSERSIGAALAGVDRETVVVCTKAGFLTPGAVPESLNRDVVVGGMHSMHGEFLADQIDRSRANLGIDTIDVFYLHNPETQLGFASPDQFEARIRCAFAHLERQAETGKIRYYGAATWEGFRQRGALDLEQMAEIAVEEGGKNHRFRFIQLPFNLAMVEAYVDRPASVLERAATLGITVVASAAIMQGKMLGHMPEPVAGLLPGLDTDAQRGIQFTRSTPGIAVALVGMSQAAHVRENLGVAAVEPAMPEQYVRLYQ